MPDDPAAIKIFPRNLTARADYVVRGNPANTRPESGVDNCYPGLEFDQRNLDKAFFPGLAFEFHRGDGATVISAAPAPQAGQPWPEEADYTGTRRLWLWAMAGRLSVEQTQPSLIFFNGLAGLDVWRRVHDLMPDRIAILIGSVPGFSAEPRPDAVQALIDAFNSGTARESRASGVLRWLALGGERARYLDEGGVIDPDVYEPGDLTRSLCAPWQYDFRDCGCFYWAASKPDLVTSADGRYPYLNFQRRDRVTDPPPADVPPWDQRSDLELGYGELVGGAWNQLPVVLNDRESETFTPPPPAPMDRLWTPDEVIAELRYLATVEHALSVEYLYSHYSVDAPIERPEDADATTLQRFSAAYEVFLVAVDEMRHFRWANEALALLGTPPSLGRAERLGRELDHPFELRPLTPEQLDWYIEVEAPSQAINEGLDGMYVRLHVSIDSQPDLFAERERLVALIKLIIDEGEGHYRRFTAVKRELADQSPQEYLRDLAPVSPDSDEAPLADLIDANYGIVLGTLSIALALGDRGGGVLLEQSKRAMYNLHEGAHRLAQQGFAPRFTLPTHAVPPPPPPLARRAAVAAEPLSAIVDAFAAPFETALERSLAHADPAIRDLAARQRERARDMFASIRVAVGESGTR